MASTDRIFVSPGVFTSEKDLTFVTRQVGVTTLGLVGETPKGPAEEPVFVSNYNDFISYFGGLNPETFKGTGYHKYELNYIAKSFLTQTNQLYVSRVLGYSGYKAGDAWCITLESAADPSTATVVSTTTDGGLTFSATTGGTPVTMTFADATLQSLYDNGEISSSFSNIGTLSVGEKITITEPKYNKTGCDFEGATFDLEVVSTGSGSAGFVTGETTGTVVTYTASCYSDIDGSVVATLRSRGGYNGDEILDYEVATAEMVNTSLISSDALATFTISGTTTNGGTFTYDTSLDRTNKNYLPGLLGTKVQDKETELFAEELYINSLEDLISAEKVRGLGISFNEIPAS